MLKGYVGPETMPGLVHCLGSNGDTQVLDKKGGFCNRYDMVRISIAEDIGHRVEEKLIYQHVDIVPFIRDVLRWQLGKHAVNEQMLILNFG